MIKLLQAARLWNGPSFRGSDKWRNCARFQNKMACEQSTEQACRWGFKPFVCEMRLREYKSTLIDKGLNYFILVKLLTLETIVSQRPWTMLILAAIESPRGDSNCYMTGGSES